MCGNAVFECGKCGTPQPYVDRLSTGLRLILERLVHKRQQVRVEEPIVDGGELRILRRRILALRERVAAFLKSRLIALVCLDQWNHGPETNKTVLA